MSASERAKEYFKEGCNCAQAVALAFADRIDLPAESIKRATVALGGGLGRLRETCGAVTGGAVALGLIFPEKSKSEIYALVQKLAMRFKEQNGSYQCGQLLTGAGIVTDKSPQAEPRTEGYYKKRPCAELVACAAEILEQIVEEG